MISNVMQCCYTNNQSYDEDNIVKTGWHPVAVSEDIPLEAYKKCVQIQGSLSNYSADLFLSSVKLFDIDVDNNNLYMTYAQYGLQDHNGRPSMFAHTFIFSWIEDQLLDAPNYFLTIEENNFKASEEDALSIQEGLSRIDAFDLQEVLQALHMNDLQYAVLIKCVYARLRSENLFMRPLYIQYDGTDLNMRRLLYCIYSSLPHHLRKKISVTSCSEANYEKKTLVFSEKANAFELYIDPMTTENNVLTERVNTIINNDGYITYALDNFRKIDLEQFFSEIDAKARKLGDDSFSNRLVLRIAFYMLSRKNLDELNDIELQKNLSDALSIENSDSDLLFEYITSLLSVIAERKIVMTDEMENILTDIVSKSKREPMEKALKQYFYNKFFNLPIEAAAKELDSFDSNVFSQYESILLESPEGNRILEYYYIEYKIRNINQWSELVILKERLNNMLSNKKIRSVFIDRARMLYNKDMKNSFDIEVYDSYLELIRDIVNEDEFEYICADAKKVVWNAVNFNNYSFIADRQALYFKVKDDSLKCKMFFDYTELINIYYRKELEIFLWDFFCFLRRYPEYLGREEKQEAIDKLGNELAISDSKEQKKVLESIEIVASIDSETGIKSFLSLSEKIRKMKKADDSYYKSLVENYEMFLKVIKSQKDLKEIITKIDFIILQAFRLNDFENTPVTVDAWLMIGKNEYSNPFDIFCEEKNYIINSEKTDFISTSVFLGEPSIQEAAKQFIKKKSKESKRVKRWLKELKKHSIKRKRSKKKIKNKDQE